MANSEYFAAPDLICRDPRASFDYLLFNSHRNTDGFSEPFGIVHFADGVCGRFRLLAFHSIGGGRPFHFVQLQNSGRAAVATIAKNTVWHAIALFAIAKAGATVVPVNYRPKPDEWQFIIEDCGARLLLVAPEFAAAAPAVSPIIVMGNWDQWLSNGATAMTANVDPVETAEAIELYTSGTVGEPKGVIWTHEGLGGRIEAVRATLGIRPGDRILMALPMSHIFWAVMTFLSVRCGATLRLVADFQPPEVIRILAEEDVAVAPLVPAMIQACLAVPGVETNQFLRLRTVVYGASTIVERTLRNAAEVFRCGFIQLYGMSELSPISALSAEDHVLALPSKPSLLLSAGRAVPGVELKITDAEGSAAPTGVQGEDISPREVEEILFQMPEIADAAVVGVPHEQWGEAVHAVIVTRPNEHLNEADVISFVRARLAHFKCPKSIEFVSALPRNSSGKVLKGQLREPFGAKRAGASKTCSNLLRWLADPRLLVHDKLR